MKKINLASKEQNSIQTFKKDLLETSSRRVALPPKPDLSDEKQFTKIAKFCNFHKKIFDLTSLENGQGKSPSNSGHKYSRRKMLNKNPNCNHNSNNIFYQPCFNIKFDDKAQKKEEALKKYFFPESDKAEPKIPKDLNFVEEMIRFMKTKGTQNFINFLKEDVRHEFKRISKNPDLPIWTDEKPSLDLSGCIRRKKSADINTTPSPLSKMAIANKTYFLMLLIERRITGNNLIKTLETFQYYTPQRYDESCSLCKWIDISISEGSKVCNDPEFPFFKKFQIVQNESSKLKRNLAKSYKYQPKLSFLSHGEQPVFNRVLGCSKISNSSKTPIVKQKKKSIQVPIWKQKPPEGKDKAEWKEKAYRKYLEHICETNGVAITKNNTLNAKQKHCQQQFKYFVGHGNNSKLVQKALKKRFWWVAGSREEWQGFNFIWTQWRRNFIIKTLQLEDNLQPDSDDLTTCLTDKAHNDNCSDFDQEESECFVEKKSNPCNEEDSKQELNVSRPRPTNVLTQIETSSLHEDTIYNHLEGNFHLSNKKALFYNMKALCDWNEEDVFEYLPVTFHIKEGLFDAEFSKFEQYYHSLQDKLKDSKRKYHNTWIIKPGENTNRGCGIQYCTDFEDIKRIIGKKVCFPSTGSTRSYIIQKYLDNPFLYNKRKFDIRCFILITSYNGNIQAYWAKDGYMRTASREFSITNRSKYIHLTNDAIQKHCDDYSKYENGNKLSYYNFQKYLDKNHPHLKCDFQKDIVPKLKKITLKGVESVYKGLNPKKRKHMFEIFGLDFILDDKLKPFLLEMNTNPCLELSSTYLSYLIPHIIESAIQVAVDPFFQPEIWPKSKRHLIPEPTETFELIFNERTDGHKFKKFQGPKPGNFEVIEEEDV
ncbi:unnamed protein product [Moneuplotes crassus]|uniref:Uncharacterized protein n=1 Tax=Euplotes crassus TaxID=5936 RepID=A0AAD1UG65_EUPCR|nr:unnamed protein product [Moneuplotes crassus]